MNEIKKDSLRPRLEPTTLRLLLESITQTIKPPMQKKLQNISGKTSIYIKVMQKSPKYSQKPDFPQTNDPH